MKKWKHMLILAMLTILTACSTDHEHEESSEHSGIEMPENKEMAEESGPGTPFRFFEKQQGNNTGLL